MFQLTKIIRTGWPSAAVCTQRQPYRRQPMCADRRPLRLSKDKFCIVSSRAADPSTSGLSPSLNTATSMRLWVLTIYMMSAASYRTSSSLKTLGRELPFLSKIGIVVLHWSPFQKYIYLYIDIYIFFYEVKSIQHWWVCAPYILPLFMRPQLGVKT